MADYWARRNKLFDSLRGLPPQAKGLAQALAARSSNTVPLNCRDLALVLYPTYVIQVPRPGHAQIYSLTVRGWLYKEGDLRSRKARIVISTAERVVGNVNKDSGDPVDLDTAEQQLIDAFSSGDPEPDDHRSNAPSIAPSIASSTSSDGQSHNETESLRSGSTRSSASSATDSIIASRTRLMFRKGAPERELELEIWPQTGSGASPKHYWISTDENGRFEHTYEVPFQPAQVVAKLEADEGGPVARISPHFMKDEGITIISDIDDTVRLTGIAKGRRETLRNVLGASFDQVQLRGVNGWYRNMSDAGASFHFVSNSPWQLFDIVHGYLDHHKFPAGSIHLKYYQGLFDGIFEPVASRKKKTLEKILNDFPHRKFILIGDSGELDLEAYTLLAQNHPDQVLAIYIRDVTLPESEDLSALDIEQFATEDSSAHEREPADHDLIDLDGPARAPPVPKRPSALRDHIQQRRVASGEANKEKDTDSDTHERTPEQRKLREAILYNQRHGGTNGGVSGAIYGATNIATSTAGAAVDALRAMHKRGSESALRPGPPTLPPRPGTSTSATPAAAPAPEIPAAPPRRHDSAMSDSSASSSSTKISASSRKRTSRLKNPPPQFVSSSQDYSEYERTSADKQVEAWKMRVSIARRSLPPGVVLKMWREPKDVEASALKLLRGQSEDLL